MSTLPRVDADGVAAIVVSSGQPALVAALVRALEGVLGAGLRLVIIDNGSGEDAVREIQEGIRGLPRESSITFIASPRDLGACNAVNLGIETALGEGEGPIPRFIWLLEPGVTISEGTLTELLAVAHESGAGIVSAPEDGESGGWPGRFAAAPHRSAPGDHQPRWAPARKCAAWCALFDSRLVRDLIEQDGYFQDARLVVDPGLWDVSLRAARRGHPVAKAMHCDARTSASRPGGSGQRADQYYTARSAIIIARRYQPAWRFWLLLAPELLGDIARLARPRDGRGRVYRGAYFRGVFDGLRGRVGPWPGQPG